MINQILNNLNSANTKSVTGEATAIKNETATADKTTTTNEAVVTEAVDTSKVNAAVKSEPIATQTDSVAGQTDSTDNLNVDVSAPVSTPVPIVKPV